MLSFNLYVCLHASFIVCIKKRRYAIHARYALIGFVHNLHKDGAQTTPSNLQKITKKNPKTDKGSQLSTLMKYSLELLGPLSVVRFFCRFTVFVIRR
jgi:hypothetical protein